ncbi:MAG: bifunctional DNA-formamidopyrimidine glycosylase/DNA-(apurinic or apyrimidinic site) lyase [Candidatus Moraniibacteriota bacterium]
MPELPEVETIVRDLKQKIRNCEVVDFWTDWPKSIKINLEDFKKGIAGRKINEVKRKAKNIIVSFDDGQKMLIHLKMTGHLLLKKKDCKKTGYFNDRVNQYIHHIWYLKSPNCPSNFEYDYTLEFSDMRKFGKIKLLNKEEKDKDLEALGIEPLSKEFNLDKFKNLVSRKKKSNIKTFLLDQNIIAGIGNIYACEILFKAGIDPGRNTGSLKEKELEKLHHSIQEILQKAIKYRGTSDSDYRDTAGAPGGFQKILKVYNKEGEKCPNEKCQSKIERTKIGQRGTYWCPGCQE